MQVPGYQVLHELGRGGMAVVYKAIRESDQREVALKVMNAILAVDNDFANRFISEARIVANLAHPNIVRILDLGLVENNNYIAMEYVGGGDLKQKGLKSQLTPPQIMTIMRQVAAALSYAHEKGYVHRDVKPENILFRDDGSAVLTDFGIAKAVNASTRLTSTGMSVGTPHYMSPEQAQAKEMDGRADLYSLGCVLYELLTHSVPYDAEESFAIGLMHINQPIPVLPADLSLYQPLIDNTMGKKPENRFRDTQAFIQCIDEIEQGKRFKRPSHTKLMPVTKQRTPAIAVTSGIAAVAIAGGLYFALSPEPSVTGGAEVARLESQFSQSQDRITDLNKELETLRSQQSRASQQETSDLESFLLNQNKITGLLNQASTLLSEMKYTRPESKNAFTLYSEVLQIDPINEEALRGIDTITRFYLSRAEQLYKEDNKDAALQNLNTALQVNPKSSQVIDLHQRITSDMDQDLQELQAKLNTLEQYRKDSQGNQAELGQGKQSHWQSEYATTGITKAATETKRSRSSTAGTADCQESGAGKRVGAA